MDPFELSVGYMALEWIIFSAFPLILAVYLVIKGKEYAYGIADSRKADKKTLKLLKRDPNQCTAGDLNYAFAYPSANVNVIVSVIKRRDKALMPSLLERWFPYTAFNKPLPVDALYTSLLAHRHSMDLSFSTLQQLVGNEKAFAYFQQTD